MTRKPARDVATARGDTWEMDDIVSQDRRATTSRASGEHRRKIIKGWGMTKLAITICSNRKTITAISAHTM